MSDHDDIDALIARLTDGDQEARDRLFRLVYEELRARAHVARRRSRPGETLDTTALVSEAYQRLFDGHAPQVHDRKHLLCLMANAMRWVLVDLARKRNRVKHGGGFKRVPLEDEHAVRETEIDSILAVDAALSRLEQRDERAARVVELHYFAGMPHAEIAETLAISETTVKRDLTLAKAELHEYLSGAYDA